MPCAMSYVLFSSFSSFRLMPLDTPLFLQRFVQRAVFQKISSVFVLALKIPQICSTTSSARSLKRVLCAELSKVSNA